MTAPGHDVVAAVFRVAGDPPRLQVLLWRRAQPPHAGRWALPGGDLGERERLGASVARHLATKVDVDRIAHLEQLETRSDPRRDPRGRRLATAYLGLVPSDVESTLPPDTRWHPVGSLPRTAFDHGSIIASAHARLQAKLSYSTVAVALAPPTFTVSALRAVYVAVLGHDVSATNLLRVLSRRGVLVQAGAVRAPGPSGGRPARLYAFAGAEVVVTDPFAAFRPPGTTTDRSLADG